MNENPPARILDLSRLISRAGRMPTGIDRVEAAYLRAILGRDRDCFGLVKTSLGFVLLDRDGMQGIADRIDGRTPWGAPDRLSKVFRKLSPEARVGQSDARRLSIGRSARFRLSRLLRKHVPKRSAYINVGHTNLSDAVLHAMRHGAKASVAVMVHDTIPLDHPLYQTPESVTRFRDMLKRVRHSADLIIYNSEATRRDAARHMEQWGRMPSGVVVHLGLDKSEPDLAQLPKGMPPEEPYFLCVGTIEPRKNHALLIEVWERMVKQTTPQEMPHLILCGSRGWNNEELFFRLDKSPLKNRHIHELSGLSDGAIAALIQGAAGALFPSMAEGFGLPPVEAAAAGVPIICAKLPVYEELLGNIPVYASLKDSYLWQRRITALANSQRAGRDNNAQDRHGAYTPPSWDAHFNVILKMT